MGREATNTARRWFQPVAKKPAAKTVKRGSSPVSSRQVASPGNPLQDLLKQMEAAPTPAPTAPDDAAAIEEADEAFGKALHLNVKKALRQEAPAESAGAGLSLCPNCGAFVDGKAEACDRCGVVLLGDDGEVPAPSTTVETTLEEAGEVPPPKASRSKKGKRR